MSRKRRRRTSGVMLHDWFWSSNWRQAVTSITAGLALVAALAGAIKAGPEIVPLLPAHRGYVVELVDEQKSVINSLRVEQIKRELRSLDREETQWKVKLPNETDAGARRLIENRLKQIDEDQERLNKQIEKLR